MYLFTAESWRFLTSAMIYVSHTAACKGHRSITIQKQTVLQAHQGINKKFYLALQ